MRPKISWYLPKQRDRERHLTGYSWASPIKLWRESKSFHWLYHMIIFFIFEFYFSKIWLTFEMRHSNTVSNGNKVSNSFPITNWIPSYKWLEITSRNSLFKCVCVHSVVTWFILAYLDEKIYPCCNSVLTHRAVLICNICGMITEYSFCSYSIVIHHRICISPSTMSLFLF